MTPVAIALGSNLGDRRGHLDWAIEQLGCTLSDLRVSSIIETEPVDVPGPQGPFLNGAVIGRTTLAPAALLDVLLGLEQTRGRTRPAPHAPRTLDLDLILYGDVVLDSPALVLPHPHFRERRFVLEPLAEIAWEWIDPVTGKTVAQLMRQIG